MSNEQTQADIASFPSREKLWTERNQEEKLEALRQELLKTISGTQMAQEMSSRLMHHVHGLHGEILAPMDRLDGPQGRRYVPMSLRDKE